ncbi:MAG: hypothetical protein MK213_10170 [Planctomycetes bacterium]|nr:hypothetical protein [Planctomycetota bacterium]
MRLSGGEGRVDPFGTQRLGVEGVLVNGIVDDDSGGGRAILLSQDGF